ncbi:hypothetical protein ABIB25_005696 [Nakamurella sp. UYEF19]|uniref:hypothetical protein n=1 Tax=Nakamurella sp. UYEF19 TaxID=1756392 RepID=UPI003390CBE0
MTLDGAGNVSLTTPTPNGGDQTVITTLPVRGEPPQVRMLTSTGNNGLEDGSLSNVVEARDCTLYIETISTGGSGPSWIMRVKPGRANVAPGTPLPLPLSEQVSTVDPFNNVFVLQNRLWYTNPALGDGSCTEDYGVDAVQKFTSSGSTPASVLVTGLNIPAGGIAVAATGVIYAAVVLSRSANPFTTTIAPQLARINPADGTPVVIASGHLKMPVAEDVNWYVN